jgi:hypothetical protein
MSWPLAQGDQVWLLFGSRDISGWKSGGEASAPRSQRRAGLSDAVALAGFAPSTGDPLIELVITPEGKVRFGSPAVDIVSILKQTLDQLVAATVAPTGGALINVAAFEALSGQIATLVDS